MEWIQFSLVVLLVFTPYIFYWDLRYFRIPDWITFPLFILVVLGRIRFPGPEYWWLPDVLLPALFWGIVAYVQRDKIGLGDIKLGIALAPAVAFPGWVFSIWIAAFSSLFVFFILWLKKYHILTKKIPFGPSLVLGYGCMLVYYLIFGV